ncbi:MAG: ATP-binding cassette domain-containing protein [Desulfurococcaceae archaeon]
MKVEPLLRLVELSAGYGGVPVVRGVSLDVGAREKVVIMGPNGSGKSTLLKAIPRLIEPLSGSILFRGIDVTRLPERELAGVRSKMGYLPQGSTLFPHMRAVDNVALPLRLVLRMGKEEARRRAIEYLELLGVADAAQKYPAQLSGGQRQRVALARALAMEPDLLLLDEPTSSLDPESRADVLEMLEEVAKLGKAMVVVTHETEFASKLADKVLVIKEGRPHYVGPYSEEALRGLGIARG